MRDLIFHLVVVGFLMFAVYMFFRPDCKRFCQKYKENRDAGFSPLPAAVRAAGSTLTLLFAAE